MRKQALCLFLLLALTFFPRLLSAQAVGELPHASPESQGVSSAGIGAFLDAAGKSKTEFHSYVFLRHGKIISEGWWNPYAPGLKHTMYSCSKSFTATAVGFAVNEQKLKLEDKVISFFPRELPDTVSEYLSGLTVRDLLTMSVGMEPEPTTAVVSRDSDWVKGFLAWPVKYKPGSRFLYNTLASFMLSAIVQHATGEKLIDYLRPRLFAPLGITDIDWELNPQGINTGGWGLRIKTEDMARFGQLFLQRGRWGGRQILPPGWVDSASTLKIVQHPDSPAAKRDTSDWEQGYCYQMWRCRHNAYRADGAFGQFIIMMPDQDAVLAITAETPDMQAEINLVWKYLLPAIHDGVLPENRSGDLTLESKNAHLSLTKPLAGQMPSAAAAWSGKTFVIDSNATGLESLSLEIGAPGGMFAETVYGKTYRIPFAAGEWKESVSDNPGPDLVSGDRTNFKTFSAEKVAGASHWVDDHTLVLTLRYIESPHTLTLTFRFAGNALSLDGEASFFYGKKKTTYRGRML